MAAYSTASHLTAGITIFGRESVPSAVLDSTTGNLYKAAANISYIAQLDGATAAVTGQIPLPRPGRVAIDEAAGTLVFATAGEALLIPLQATGPITSAGAATFTTATMGRFTVTAPGTPPPTFTEAGKLPAGVSLAASGILGGMPSTGTGGTYHITITARNGTATIAGAPASTAKGKSNLIRLTATNGVGAAITQRFTLKVT